MTTPARATSKGKKRKCNGSQENETPEVQTLEVFEYDHFVIPGKETLTCHLPRYKVAAEKLLKTKVPEEVAKAQEKVGAFYKKLKKEAPIPNYNLVSTSLTHEEVPVDTFYCLLPGKWLGDEAINAILLALRLEVPGLFCFSPLSLDRALALDKRGHIKRDALAHQFRRYKKWEESYKKRKVTTEKLLDYETLMFALNIQNEHWMLVFFDTASKKLFIADSMYGTKEKLHEYINGIVAALLDLTGEDKINIYRLMVPQQPNGFDCGVYTLASATLVARGISPECFAPSEVDAFRLKIFESIFIGKLTF